jgi:uroporphyrin-III C-methyltransferase
MNHSNGKVFLVGAGPGAADLITVRGMKLLQQADIVFHDALIDPQMLDFCIQAILIPVGKRCGRHSTAQAFINKRLIDASQKHQIIVRLKGGDPMIFGRADEEISALESAGIDVEVVPGITAALAASASLKQSLTLRGVSRSVAFFTHVKAENQESAVLPEADTLVIYMGRSESEMIAKKLLDQGKPEDTPVQIIEAISTKQERKLSLTLKEMHEGAALTWFNQDSPALLLVGAVFRNRLQDSEIITNRRLYG